MKVSENRETGESKSHDAVSLCRLAIEAVAKSARVDGEEASKTESRLLTDSSREMPAPKTSEALDTSDVVVEVSSLTTCEDRYSENDELPKEASEYRNDPTIQLICPSHDYRLLNLYCATCETGICNMCADRSHFEHDVETLVDAIGKERFALQRMAHDVEARVPLVEETIDQVCIVVYLCSI